MNGNAECFGAGTLVSAIATGKGASFGLGLKLTAKVTLTDDKGKITVNIKGANSEPTMLAETACKKTLDMLGGEKYGAIVETDSKIPISRGLKSSSAASIAIILATASALGVKYVPSSEEGKKDAINAKEVLDLSCDSALESGVSITGAFDDAAACLLGGAVVTDNRARKILASYPIEPELDVVIYVPPRKVRKASVKEYDGRLDHLGSIVGLAHKLALMRNFKDAMTLNGLVYSNAFGEYRSSEMALRMLDAGAHCAGMSGTGPATIAIVGRDKTDAVLKAVRENLEKGAKVIKTKVRNGEG